MIEESSLIPSSDFPSIEWAGRSPTNWLWEFERQNYEKQGGHPIYSETDVEYRFNKYGYRCQDFNSKTAIKVVSIGCSYVFGFALPQEEIFHERLCKRLEEHLGCSVTNWNLAFGGASNDYIARTLQLCVPRLDPDLILINFTWAARREYIAANGRSYQYLPSVSPNWNPVLSECFKHLTALASEKDDQLNFFKNYKAIESLLVGRRWLFSAIVKEIPEMIFHHINWDHCCGAFIDENGILDYARDNRHPGRAHHEKMAKAYWDRIEQLGWIEALSGLGV